MCFPGLIQSNTYHDPWCTRNLIFFLKLSLNKPHEFSSTTRPLTLWFASFTGSTQSSIQINHGSEFSASGTTINDYVLKYVFNRNGISFLMFTGMVCYQEITMNGSKLLESKPTPTSNILLLAIALIIVGLFILQVLLIMNINHTIKLQTDEEGKSIFRNGTFKSLTKNKFAYF